MKKPRYIRNIVKEPLIICIKYYRIWTINGKNLSNSFENLKYCINTEIKDKFVNAFDSLKDLFKPFQEFKTIEEKVMRYESTIYTYQELVNMGIEISFWKLNIKKMNENILEIKTTYEHIQSLSAQIKKSDNAVSDPTFDETMKQADKLVESLPEDNKIKSLEVKVNQMKIQNMLTRINRGLKEINEYLSLKEQYEYNSHIHYSKMSEWRKKLKKLIKDRGETFTFRSIIRQYGKQLGDKYVESMVSMRNDLLSHEISTLERCHQAAKEQLETTKEYIDKYNITVEDLLKLSDELAQQECIQRGRELPTIIQHESTERMDKGLINKSLTTFYDFSAEPLKGWDQTPKDIQELAKQGLLEGDVDDYFIVQMWPKTSDNTKSLKGNPPYRAYINPNPKIGIMANFWTYRHEEKELLKEWQPEDLPKAYWEALRASDMIAQLYQLAVDKYKEKPLHDGTGAHTQLPGSDVPRFSLKVGLDLIVRNKKANKVFSHYVKQNEKLSRDVEQGKVMTFSKEDEGFHLLMGTPLGRIRPFMLAQHPEKVGGGEITHVDVQMESSGKHIKYMKWYIAEKENSESV